MSQAVLMSPQVLKKIEGTLLSLYPFLRQPGAYRPAAKGRTVLNPGQILALFNDKNDAQYLVDVAIYITGRRLSEVWKSDKFTNGELPAILNQHFDLAELVLLHHSKRIPGLYGDNIEGMEEQRGKYLGQMAMAEDSVPEAWTEYAYWLVGCADKVKETDAASYEAFNKEAETYFRKAHKAGHVEATDALATLIYTSTDMVGAATFYWEKAAMAGHVTAIQNLYNVVLGDARLTPAEFVSGIASIWKGVAVNKKETKDIVTALNKAGFMAPPKPKHSAKDHELAIA